MLRLRISGMTCEHCVAAIARAVRAVPGVRDVAVDLATGRLEVVGSPDETAIRAAIAEQGYGVD